MMQYIDALKKAMSALEKAKDEKRVIMFSQYRERFPEASIAQHMEVHSNGFTNHPAFELLPTCHATYRLKFGCSASKALHDLLHADYVMTIDCGLAAIMAHYLALLDSMKTIHGEKAGAQRFDRLFGEEAKETPELRRLLLSPEGPMMGTAYIPKNLVTNQIFELQPLSYLFDMGHDKSAIPAGSIAVFIGDINYKEKHPAGESIAFTGIVMSLKPFTLQSFNCGYEPLTIEQLANLHQKRFDLEPSAVSRAILGEKSYDKKMPKCDRSKIAGIAGTHFYVLPEGLEYMLHTDLNIFIPVLEDILKVRKQQSLEVTASNELSTPYFDLIHSDGLQKKEEDALLDKLEKLQIQPSSLEGNGALEDGLKGMYVSKPIASKRTPSYQTKTTDTNKSKGHYMPGMKKGFFNK